MLTREAVEVRVDWMVGATLVEARRKPRRTQVMAWLGFSELLRISIAASRRRSRTTETETTIGSWQHKTCRKRA